jgi:allantoin racemase
MMKLWYQAYNVSGRVDPNWRYFDELIEKYVPALTRRDTEVHFAWVDKRAPKMVVSKYVQYLHTGQVIEAAIRAEREGFDAFILGGMRDLGYAELREAVDIPVVFMGETSFLFACLLGSKFAMINPDRASLRDALALVRKYGLADRCLPGVHLGYSHTDLIAACEKTPERFIEEIKAAGRVAIGQGSDVLVMGFTALSVFLAMHGIRDIDGVPILDSQASVIKAAEMMVDLRKLGMPKAQGGASGVSKKDIETARRTYDIE